jgi:hypothetical protein
MLPLLMGLVSLGCLVFALVCFWPRPDPPVPAFALAVHQPEPEPILTKLRGRKALESNLFPRQHTKSCTCNARALVWVKDRHRPDGWIGACRRCGMVRYDLCQGVCLELA